ncbi:MAG: flavin reductase family protein, partial [Acidobacteriaceae bacterium]|nr:flavin reductase family protein [Acidobacteriaceae bacterium]
RSGQPYGMTVSSFTSVSFRPPLILVCIDRRAGFALDVTDELTFAVNVLREDQENVAVRFSTPPEEGRFDSFAWMPGLNGVPLLKGIVASLTCSLERVVEAGDHLIFIGCVQDIRLHGGSSLVWCQSNYHCLPPPVERI